MGTHDANDTTTARHRYWKRQRQSEPVSQLREHEPPHAGTEAAAGLCGRRTASQACPKPLGHRSNILTQPWRLDPIRPHLGSMSQPRRASSPTRHVGTAYDQIVIPLLVARPAHGHQP